MADTRSNIVWFVADQMRADAMGHMGNPAAQTPCIDALAEEGVSFEDAYCQNPVCVPSRCSFLTGLYPHTLGHRTMHFMMRQDDPNILKTMKDAGYEVVWIGRNDFIPGTWRKSEYCDHYFDGIDADDKVDVEGEGVNFGHMLEGVPAPELPAVFDDVETKYSFMQGKFPEHSLDRSFDWNCVRSALDFLDGIDPATQEKPFFIYCTLMFPHPPYGCEEPWYSLIDRDALPPRRPDVESLSGKASILTKIRERQGMQDWREVHYDEMRAVYLGMTARWDHMLGLVVDKLRERGLYDDTNIFAFSDHGDLTGDYGIAEKCQNTFEDPLARVPLVVKPARRFAVEPGVRPGLVGLIDLPATVAEIAGVDLGYVQFGSSLMDAIAGGDAPHDAIFCEGGRIHGEWQAMEPEHGPESTYWPRISAQHEEGPAHTKAAMVRMGDLKYSMRLYEGDQLYDLAADPMETVNLVDDPAYADALAKLRARLLAFYMETADYVPPRFDKR